MPRLYAIHQRKLIKPALLPLAKRLVHRTDGFCADKWILTVKRAYLFQISLKGWKRNLGDRIVLRNELALVAQRLRLLNNTAVCVEGYWPLNDVLC